MFIRSGQLQTSYIFCRPSINWCILIGICYYIRCTHLTLNFWIVNYFNSFKIILIGKNINSLEACKEHLEPFISQKHMFCVDAIMKLKNNFSETLEKLKAVVLKELLLEDEG